MTTRSYPWYLGGVSASLAAILTHPLDVSKVKLQVSPSTSMIRVLVDSVKKEGIRKGAYPGLTASVLRQMTYSLTRFGVYDQLKGQLRSPGEKNLPLWKLGIAASGAGALGGIAGNPADIVLVRMIGDTVKPEAERLKYRNCFDGVWKLVKNEGVGSLARGLGPNVSRAMLMNASQLATYESFKDMLLQSNMYREGIALHFSASVLAGTVATTACAPFDVVKSRMMSSAGNESISQVIVRSYKQEGYRWMVKGWLPAWIRLGPNTVAVFMILEQLRNLTDHLRGVK